MKQKLFVVLAVIILLLSITLSGCSGASTVTVTNTTTVTAPAGVSQADYDSLQTQLTQAQTEKTTAQTNLQVANTEIASLEAQVAAFKAQYETTSLTTEELLKKVTAQYFASHDYLKDVYDCNNMASDLWDMFKKLGISSKIVIGDIDKQINNILDSNHAWVLVEISAGQFLALDATGGIAVTKAENPLYFRGWSFSDPAKLKQNDDLKTQYNTRVAFVNMLAAEANTAGVLVNSAANEAEQDKYMTLYNKLLELKNNQETILIQLKAQIDGLATILN